MRRSSAGSVWCTTRPSGPSGKGDWPLGYAALGIVVLFCVCAAQAQQARVAWGAAEGGLRIGLVYPVRGKGVLANIVAENAGLKALVVIRTPGLRGLSVQLQSARRPVLEQTYDFEREWRRIAEHSPIGPGRPNDEFVRLEPGRSIIIGFVPAPWPGAAGLPAGWYRATALFRWTEADTAARPLRPIGALQYLGGAWSGSVKSGEIKLRLPLTSP